MDEITDKNHLLLRCPDCDEKLLQFTIKFAESHKCLLKNKTDEEDNDSHDSKQPPYCPKNSIHWDKERSNLTIGKTPPPSPVIKPYGKAAVMPFGKYKGQGIKQIANSKEGRGYLSWARHNMSLFDDTKSAIDKALLECDKDEYSDE